MQPSSAESGLVREIGKYRLIAELARGGMGIVHLAAAQGPGGFQKLLVVKELKPELALDPSYVAMFLDEARLAARLAHPNIVQTMDVGSDGERHYMVMEYLEGRSFHSIVRRARELNELTVGGQLRVVADTLLGLHYAHELRDFGGQPLGVVHRDLSPLNVLVTFDGQAKLIDFGIAKSVHSTLQTQAGVLKGRIAYMSPEQAWGHKVDRRADVYSAGVMIWEAAARRRLWHGMTDMETLTCILRDTAPRLRAVRPDAPEDLDAICARAMARQADDRYESAAALFAALEGHLATRSDNMTMREIGALAARLFAEERRKTKVHIEETVLRERSGPRSGVIRAGWVTAREPSGSTPSGAHATGRGNDASRASWPAVRAASPHAVITAPPVASSSAPRAPSTRPVGGSGPRRRLGRTVGGASTLGLFLVTGGLLLMSARVGIPPRSEPPAAAVGPVAPAAPAPEATGYDSRLEDTSARTGPARSKRADPNAYDPPFSPTTQDPTASETTTDVSLEHKDAAPPPRPRAPAPASKRVTPGAGRTDSR
jgi:serine/threonine-protein kinase